MKNADALFTQAKMGCVVKVCSKHTDFMNCDSCQMLYYTKRRADYSNSVLLQYTRFEAGAIDFLPDSKKKGQKKKRNRL